MRWALTSAQAVPPVNKDEIPLVSPYRDGLFGGGGWQMG